MKYKFEYIIDGEIYFQKEIGNIIPLGTRCCFKLSHKEMPEMFIFCTAYEYNYDIVNDTIKIRFGETDNEYGFEQESEDLQKLYDIVNSSDFNLADLSFNNFS